MKFKIKTFNGIFWLLVLITLLASLLFRNYYLAHGFIAARKLFYIIHIFGCLYYIRYKVALVTDKEYDALLRKANLPAEDIWVEIFPFQLCNASYILVPIGLAKMMPALLAYSEIAVPLCVVIALLMPVPFLSDDSLLKPRVAGFYITHLYMLFMSLCCWFMQVKSLRYSDALGGVVIIFVITLVAHTANVAIKTLGLSNNANYLFTMHHSNNPILKKLWDLNPKELFYLLPLFPLVYIVFLFVVFVTKFIF